MTVDTCIIQRPNNIWLAILLCNSSDSLKNVKIKNHFFIFNSHSRNSLGLQCPNSGADLLKITSAESVSIFLMKQCQARRGIDNNMYYELSGCNFILLEVTNDLLQCNGLEKSVMDCRHDYSSCINEDNTDI